MGVETKPKLIAITSLRYGGETQARAATCADTVREYAEAMKAGAAFPPVIVFHDALDLYYVGDGTHRVLAKIECGNLAIECEVRPGGLLAAKKFACSANRDHGLKRTNADKRKAVKMYWDLVKEENPRPSNPQIAEWCGVSDQIVRDVIKSDPGSIISNLVKGKDGKTYPAKKPAPAAPAKTTPPPEPIEVEEDRPPEPVEVADLVEVLADEVGHKIPEEAREAFSVVLLYDECDKLTRALQKLVNEIGLHSGGCELRRHLRPVGPEGKAILKSDHLINLMSDLKYTRPYSICCRCKGKAKADCKGCSGRGWWTETTWKGANPETKAGAK